MPPSETLRTLGERPFQCRICKSSFSKSEHLARHVRSHTKEKPFRCPECGNRYSRQDILIRHRRDVKCRPSGDQISMEDHVSGLEDTSSTSGLGLNGPVSQGISTAVPGDAEAQAPVLMSNPSPEVAHLSFAPPYNPAVLMESTGMGSNDSLLPEEPSIHIDQFPMTMSDLSYFDSFRQIDATLREEISAASFPSFQQTHIFESNPVEALSSEQCVLQTVHSLWFTNIAESHLQIPILGQSHEQQNSQVLSPKSTNTTISDEHRQSMWERLQIITYEPTVPSTDILNVSLRLYFAKVHAIFPLVHRATFQPCKENADLVIAMCAIGVLFTGSDQSLQQGIYLFERVQKATLHNWEQLLARGKWELTIAIQSAAISQLFGLLSGSADLLLTVDAFHGPPISWSRYLHLYSRRTITRIDDAMDGDELEETWHTWARSEEIIRVAHGLSIMDAELAAILHHEPIQSWQAYKLPYACSEKAFSACNARDWKAVYCEELDRQRFNSRPARSSSTDSKLRLFRSSYVPETSSLTAYAAMESISSQALSQMSYQDTGKQTIEDVHQAFADLHHQTLPSWSSRHHFQIGQEPTLQLLVLQCLIYMEALADFEFLERAVGRDGTRLTAEETTAATAWANSVHAQRCILHAIAIKKQVEARRITSEPALHIPRAVFWAGLAVFCYIRFGTTDRQPLHCIFQSPSTINIDFPEFSAMGINLQTLATEHAGHWRITKRFAAILTAMGSNFTPSST